METITIEDIEYITFDYLKKNAPLFCSGSRSGKEFITKYSIDENTWIYAKKSNEGVWNESNGKSKKYDKVLIRYDYVKNTPNVWKELCGEVYADTPDLIYLEDEEKFTDNEGNIYEIETRGVRKYDGVFFRVKDVADAIGMDNLRKTLVKERTNYYEYNDYMFFICPNGNNVSNPRIRALFLTYSGLIKVLFRSRNSVAEKFIQWASRVLFSAHLGTVEDKSALSAKLLGTTPRVIKEVFNKTSRKMSCIYLIQLGTVADLIDSMDIPGDTYYTDDIVCKYGMTNDLERRIKEHEKEYSKYSGVSVQLKMYEYIDPMYVSDAEGVLKAYFHSTNMAFEFKNYSELVIIEKDKIKNVKEQYCTIGQAYMGHVSELLSRINIIKKEQDLLIERERSRCLEKDVLIERERSRCLEKDVEIEKLKHQISVLKRRSHNQ